MKPPTTRNFMAALSRTEKARLLHLARSAIVTWLDTGASPPLPADLAPIMLQKRGCFVTLHKHGALRGCIGTLEPVKALGACVVENAINAAFRDPRFTPLESSELPAVEIEISVLTPPRKLHFQDPEGLKKQLEPGKHGVILSQEGARATFLPQVWQQLPDVEAFLTHLCQKGGMPGACWKDPNTRVSVYEVEYFK
jgi:AmmeMemoRadiSam system protein A